MSELAGIGIIIIALPFGYMLYQLARQWRVDSDIEERIGILKEKALERIAKKKGIDLELETQKKLLFKESKSFRKKIKEEIYKETFGGTK